MGRNFVDRVFCSINGQELVDCVSFSVDTEDGTQSIAAMSRNRRDIGYTRGNMKPTFEMVVALRQGTPELDWRDLQSKGKAFLLTYEEGDGGKRRQLVDARITRIGTPSSSEGETRQTISGMALDDRPVK